MELKKLAFSLFLLTCFFAQLALPLYHSLEDEHSIEHCDFNDVEHICDHHSENHKHYLELNLNFTNNFEYQLNNTLEITSVDILKSNFLINHKQLAFSLRGLPHHNFI